MKIYAVADIHGCHKKISMIQEIISVHHPDVLVVAGDITNYFSGYSAINILNNYRIPVLAVRGNSDRKCVESILQKSCNITSLDLADVSLNGVNFTGISGAIPILFRTKLKLNERLVRKEMAHILGPMSVLVVHPPPFGVLDRVFKKIHAGCRGLKEIILRSQPRLVICGHIHEDFGVDYINETMVINCSVGGHGCGALIDLKDNEKPNVLLL